VSQTVWKWGRLLGPPAVLGVLVWHLGTGPFLEGLRRVDGRALAGAAALAGLTTVCSAWRWTIVARGLGVELSLPAAVGAYYRSVFLNLTLPGGIVGDIHRAVNHGREVSDAGRACRAVAWERLAGQVVQAFLTIAVLLVLSSPVPASVPLAAIALVVALSGVVLLARVRSRGARSAWARGWSAAAGDIRHGLLARGAWPRIALASVVIVAGHTTTFLIAARTAGTDAPLPRMLPIALLVMLAGLLPSVGGWGPRDGVAAWAFGAAGLGAGRGVGTAVVFGVMVFVASLPGAVVLVVGWFHGLRPAAPQDPRVRQKPVHA
jgi:uncharacterized membrane protein YbhN (UPF0104 family)